jgi:hypothetical protein
MLPFGDVDATLAAEGSVAKPSAIAISFKSQTGVLADN